MIRIQPVLFALCLIFAPTVSSAQRKEAGFWGMGGDWSCAKWQSTPENYSVGQWWVLGFFPVKIELRLRLSDSKPIPKASSER